MPDNQRLIDALDRLSSQLSRQTEVITGQPAPPGAAGGMEKPTRELPREAPRSQSQKPQGQGGNMPGAGAAQWSMPTVAAAAVVAAEYAWRKIEQLSAVATGANHFSFSAGAPLGQQMSDFGAQAEANSPTLSGRVSRGFRNFVDEELPSFNRSRDWHVNRAVGGFT